MFKTKKLLVQETFDDMISQLEQQKNTITADLDSKEKSLISEVNKNPRFWNSQSLKFNMKTNKPDLSSVVGMDVTLTQVWFRIDVSSTSSTDFLTMIQNS